MTLCRRCGQYPVESFYDGEQSNQCGHCIDIERANAHQEWDYFHPGEPMPEIEMPRRHQSPVNAAPKGSDDD